MRLAEIEARIGSLGELSRIMGAMRALAGMRLQEAERDLPGANRYAETISSAVGSALTLEDERAEMSSPVSGAGPLTIVHLAEHGFVGGYNERLLDFVEALPNATARLFLVGSRGAAIAEDRGLVAEETLAMATRSGGIPEMVHRIIATLLAGIEARRIAEVDVVFATWRPDSGVRIVRRRLFPIERPPAGTGARLPPLHNLDPAALLERLAEEYVTAVLSIAAIEALASENAARFAAMDAARENVEGKLDQLRQQQRQARQDEITTELLDIVTGAAAVTIVPPP